jgi:hypothetical protein
MQAARAARTGVLRPEMRAVTPRAALFRRVLIGGEVAVVVLLLTGALLFLRTFVSLRGVDLGFQADQVWNVSARWPLGRMAPATPGQRPWPRLQRAVDGLVEAVASTPGVEAVGLISNVPLTGRALQRHGLAHRCAGRVWPDAAHRYPRSVEGRSERRDGGLLHGVARPVPARPQLHRRAIGSPMHN